MAQKISFRRQARVYSFQFLYHLQFGQFSENKGILLDSNSRDDQLPLVLKDFNENFYSKPELQEAGQDFARRIITGTLAHYKELEQIAKDATKSQRIDNIPKIDLTILLQAIFEIKYMADTPKKVIINESIELAKQFSNKDSGAFINGILDKIAKQFGQTDPE